jgi:hypothetical protein
MLLETYGLYFPAQASKTSPFPSSWNVMKWDFWQAGSGIPPLYHPESLFSASLVLPGHGDIREAKNLKDIMPLQTVFSRFVLSSSLVRSGGFCGCGF